MVILLRYDSRDSRDSRVIAQFHRILLCSCHRIDLMPGQEKQKEFRSEKTTLKEGEMWGGDVCDIESFVEEDGRINIKFIIFYLNM